MSKSYETNATCYGCANAVQGVQYCERCKITVVAADMTHPQIREAFERVQDETDWKNPIDKALRGVTIAEMNQILYAVEFFTGTKANIDLIDPSEEVTMYQPSRWNVRITAPGYYGGPCN